VPPDARFLTAGGVPSLLTHRFHVALRSSWPCATRIPPWDNHHHGHGDVHFKLMLRRFASGSTTRRAWTFLWAPRHDPATPEPSPQTPTSPVFLLQFAQLVRSFSSLLQRGPRTYENRMPILDEALADVQMSSSLVNPMYIRLRSSPRRPYVPAYSNVCLGYAALQRVSKFQS
jgi:hypothetical protein